MPRTLDCSSGCVLSFSQSRELRWCRASEISSLRKLRWTPAELLVACVVRSEERMNKLRRLLQKYDDTRCKWLFRVLWRAFHGNFMGVPWNPLGRPRVYLCKA